MSMVDCKTCENTCCQYAGEQRGFVINCTNYMPKQKPQTNADRIRAMSDEELADEFMRFFTAVMNANTDGDWSFSDDFRDELLEDLRQPVKDGDNDDFRCD